MEGSATTLAAANGAAGQLGKRKTMRELQAELLAAKARQQKEGGELPAVVDFARQVSPVREAVKLGLTLPESETLKVSERLRRKFRLGADPRRRLALYARLDRIVEIHGQDAIDVIGSVVADAVGKDHPDRWFCRAVLGRLADRKMLVNVASGDPSW